MTRSSGVVLTGSAIVLCLILCGTSSRTLALGKPDWARPYLNLPSPAGSYIARSDNWVILYEEVQFSLVSEMAIEKRVRYIIENMSDKNETFRASISYDEGQAVLEDVALNAERTIWHTINLDRNSVRASINDSFQSIFTGAENIEPQRRVVFEYTVADKLGFNPFDADLILGQFPISKVKYVLDPASVAKGLRMEMHWPEGSPVPSSFSQEADGSWLITNVPAYSRVVRGLAYQPALSDTYPYILVYAEGARGATFAGYADFYRKLWYERGASINNEQILRQVQSITSGTGTVLEKVLKIGSFVQHDIQYDDSNEKGVENWLPLATQETLRSMKADCKGKVMLAQALLKSVNVESAPILLRRSEGYFEWGSKPGTAFFNHVILAVHMPASPEKPMPATLTVGPLKGWILFDPVLETASFGEALPGYEGLPALAIVAKDESQDPQFSIHTSVPSTELLEIRLRSELTSLDVLACELDVTDNGRSELLHQLVNTYSADAISRLLKEALSGVANDPDVKSAIVTRAGADNPSMKMSFKVKFPHAIQEMTHTSLLENPCALVALLADIPNGLSPMAPVRPDDRVELSPPWDARKNSQASWVQVEATLSLSLPPSLSWAPPPPQKVDSPWLKYEMLWTFDDSGVWKGILRLEMPRGLWPSEDRKARLKTLDGVFSALYSPIVLKKSGG